MSLKPTPIGPVPELTSYVARAAFPGGNPYLCVRDALGTFYDDQRFAGLFPDRGRPAETPWRLALETRPGSLGQRGDPRRVRSARMPGMPEPPTLHAGHDRGA